MSACLILTTLFLCVLSVCDLRTRTIPGWSAPAFGVSMGMLHLFLADLSLPQFLAGLIPGAILLLLALTLRAGVGPGDGLAAMACGGALGLEREFAALTAAFVFCALFCLILLVLRRAKRSDCIPFLPFLAASHLLMLLAIAL